MKSYIHLLALAGFLFLGACANKNVPVEETQLTQAKLVEGYDVTATANAVCTCLEEKAKAKAQSTTVKKAKTSKEINLKVYKSSCEKKAFAEHGTPTSNTVKMSVESALQQKCGHYFTSKSSQSKTFTKKDALSGKAEPNRKQIKLGPVPDLVPEKE